MQDKPKKLKILHLVYPLAKTVINYALPLLLKVKVKVVVLELLPTFASLKKTVFLMDIYDKSEQANITDKELLMLIDILQQK